MPAEMQRSDLSPSSLERDSTRCPQENAPAFFRTAPRAQRPSCGGLRRGCSGRLVLMKRFRTMDDAHPTWPQTRAPRVKLLFMFYGFVRVRVSGTAQYV